MLKLNIPKYKEIELISNSSPDYISFSQGTVKVNGTPKQIKEHLQDKLKTELVDHYQYVGGILPLRQKIAASLSQKHKTKFEAENILITHGAIGGITALCLALLKSEDETLLLEPTYPSYRNIISFSKAKVAYSRALKFYKGEWTFDFEQFENNITSKTKMIILSNPVNPTGYLFKENEIRKILNLCEKRGLYLIMDEVYDNYIFEGSFFSASSLVLESKQIIRTGSFSKDYAMSGIRIGFIAADKSYISHLTAIQDGTLCCPSVIGQHAALFAMENQHLILDQVNAVKKNLDSTSLILEPLVKQKIFSFIKPKAGIFLFIKTAFEDSETFVMDILAKEKLALVPGKDFGQSKSLYPFIRLCYAREEFILKEGLQRILRYFGK